VSSDTYFENGITAVQSQIKSQWSQLETPKSRALNKNSHLVDAYCDVVERMVVFPAASMQPPIFYNPSVPQYVNFGALGHLPATRCFMVCSSVRSLILYLLNWQLLIVIIVPNIMRKADIGKCGTTKHDLLSRGKRNVSLNSTVRLSFQAPTAQSYTPTVKSHWRKTLPMPVVFTLPTQPGRIERK